MVSCHHCTLSNILSHPDFLLFNHIIPYLCTHTLHRKAIDLQAVNSVHNEPKATDRMTHIMIRQTKCVLSGMCWLIWTLQYNRKLLISSLWTLVGCCQYCVHGVVCQITFYGRQQSYRDIVWVWDKRDLEEMKAHEGNWFWYFGLIQLGLIILENLARADYSLKIFNEWPTPSQRPPPQSHAPKTHQRALTTARSRLFCNSLFIILDLLLSVLILWHVLCWEPIKPMLIPCALTQRRLLTL